LPITLNGTANGETLNGTLGNDAINGLAGDDRIRGATGNDLIDGGAGIDTALYTLQRKDYLILKNAEGYTIANKGGGSEGTDLLSNVERVSFGDTRLAFDLDGNAGKVAKILGAVFGRDSVGIREFVGIGLSFIDGGTGYEALCSLAMQAAGKTRSGDIVETLWINLVGGPMPATEKAYYAGLIDGGMSAGTLTAFAADLDLNLQNIQFAGLQQTGIEFL
jgi:serralysin